jgi:putative N6-adenine-specific DNA methylase
MEQINAAGEYNLIAKTFHGLEAILAEELTNLGADNIQIGNRTPATNV